MAYMMYNYLAYSHNSVQNGQSSEWRQRVQEGGESEKRLAHNQQASKMHSVNVCAWHAVQT